MATEALCLGAEQQQAAKDQTWTVRKDLNQRTTGVKKELQAKIRVGVLREEYTTQPKTGIGVLYPARREGFMAIDKPQDRFLIGQFSRNGIL